MTLADVKTRRWTRDEYHQMADLGFFQDQRVELIDGEIIEMAPQRETHAACVGLGRDALAASFGQGHWVRVQMPLFLGDALEPEPDLAVVRGNPRDFIGSDHPRTALLVVEVSETTLHFDRGLKANIYAAAGIAEYWIVNLVDNQIEVHRSPITDASAPHGSRYRDRNVLQSGDSVTPPGGAADRVSDLLP